MGTLCDTPSLREGCCSCSREAYEEGGALDFLLADNMCVQFKYTKVFKDETNAVLFCSSLFHSLVIDVSLI